MDPVPAESPDRGTPEEAVQRVQVVKDEFQRSRGSLDHVAMLAAEDRSWIARRIIWIFTAVIGVVLLLYFISGLQSGQWGNAATQAADLVKSVILPVVTLVLGFYFGSRSGKG